MASLKGLVADSSGAVVPNAAVTLESVLQQLTRETVTNSTGEYVVPAIPPGTYKLMVKAPGFRPETKTDFVLSSGQASTLNVVLEVATATEEVTVNEAPPLLQTSTATVGTVVQAKQVTELPMLGRNFTSLLLVAPGVNPVGPPDSVNLSVGGLSLNPSVYGQRQRDNNFTLDGVGNNEPLFNGIPMFPPPEAIGEMKIESGISSGASGYASGANVNLVTRSGTRDIHGDLWESLRNNVFDARSFFLPTLGAFRWNQFGVAAGGPVVVPKLVSKEHAWYFFGYYEGIRVSRVSNASNLVPTPDQINGNLDGLPPIYNPYSTRTGADGQLVRDPFPGNRIPSNLLNSAAVTMSKELYPAPNLAPGVIPGKNYLNTGGIFTNGDQWSGRVDHQFGKKDQMFARYSDARDPSFSQSLPALATNDMKRLSNIAAADTHIFSPSTLVTLRFGLQRINWNVFNVGSGDLPTRLGTTGAFPAFEGHDIIPPVTIPGWAGLSYSPQIYGPQYQITGTADWQKTIGRSTFAFGGGITHTQFITNNLSGTSVQFSALQTSDFTSSAGSPLASFLLGVPESAGRLFGNSEGNLQGKAYSLYFQENFRATPKLTVNLGLRWDYAPPMTSKYGSGTFIFETGQYVWDLQNPITNAAPNIRRGSIVPDRRGFQPRVGIAYELTPKTVIRTSYGIFFDTFGNNYSQTQQGNRGNWPFAFPQQVTALNRTVPTAFLQNPFPGPAQGSQTPLGCQQCLNVWEPTSRTPYVQQWTISLQRQITPTLLGEAVYFGSHGLRLSGQIIDNVAMTPGPGNFQDRQLYSQFPPYVLNGVNIFPSYYDGLSLKLEKRLSFGLSFLATYTWSKTIDYLDSFVNGALGGQPFSNPTRFNIRSNKSLAGFDVPQRDAISYIYELPVKSKNRAVNAVAGNWSVAGVTTFDTGLPFFPLLTTDNENIGTVGGRNTEFPNVVGNPNAIAQRTPQHWFNTDAFAVPAPYTIGNAGRFVVRSDKFLNWDFSVFKKWPFQEKRSLELRGEFFNLFNNVNFGYPGGLLNTPQFGVVSSTRNSGRQTQLGMKLHF